MKPGKRCRILELTDRVYRENQKKTIAEMEVKCETEQLGLIVTGYTNPEIAAELFLGVETINSYRKNLLFKLNA